MTRVLIAWGVYAVLFTVVFVTAELRAERREKRRGEDSR